MEENKKLVNELIQHGFNRDSHGFYIKRHYEITVEVFGLSSGVAVKTPNLTDHAYVTSLGDIKQLLVKNNLPYRWI